jgi:ribosomal protein S25
MRPLVPILLLVGFLLTSGAALGNSVEESDLTQQLEETLEEIGQTLDDPALADTQADEEVGISGLLSDVGGFFGAIGGAIAVGVQQAGLLAVGGLTAAAGAAVTTMMATREALFWSIAGVYGLMTGTVTATVNAIVDLAAGAWALVATFATAVAQGRPMGMSQPAWAAGVAVGATAASASAHVGLWNLLRRFGWLGAGLPLFSRIEKDDLLDHPLRSEIYEAIKTNPGIHISALARTVDAGWGTTIHHLRKLKDEDMVAVRLVNNQKCYFINGGGVGADTWSAVSHLKNGTARKIAEFVHAHPLIAVTDLSKQLGISASLVSHHVAKLSRAGILEKVRDGRFIRLTLTQKASSTMFREQTPMAPAAQPLAA